MGTWDAHLAFRDLADRQRPLADLESSAAAVNGWVHLTVPARDYARVEDALDGIAGPALASMVFDSDFAEVSGYFNGELKWSAHINQDIAAEFDIPVSEHPLDQITVWARTAGSPPVDRERLRQILAGDYVFADDGLLRLEQLLGVVSPEAQPFGDDERSST